MPRIDSTDRALIAMLTENTGRNMLDSGGAYGRNFERNQHRDFMREPATSFCIREYNGQPDIEVTHNVFHWLRERVTYNAKLTTKFRRFAARPANRDSHWLELMESFVDKYGDDPQTVNTYNGEDLLSQVLQYTLFSDDDGYHVLLQIHGGCDVRGGYTAPRIFDCDDSALYDNASATIWEDCPDDGQLALPGVKTERWGANWYSDDGCHWCRDGACGAGVPAQLQTYEVTTDPAEKGCGKIYLDGDGKAYGPLCGGELHAGF